MRAASSIHQGPAATSDGASQAAAAVERMTTGEVLALARISRATLWRRISCGRLPRPVDQARQALFLKADVLQALAAVRQSDSISVAIEQRLEALRQRRQKQA
ncbi:MAG: hypothetical protein KJ676_10845 [Alphaproteobacteria bacterium]|nr:hypothetical protein [Alphaproteobacteria bacterium]MBU2350754.1 hypothetical protein [Alphaproteobacteria bacterium]MBU2382963.1 hypothetical protein [Alphaproteobacteria bacterium]